MVEIIKAEIPQKKSRKIIPISISENNSAFYLNILFPEAS